MLRRIKISKKFLIGLLVCLPFLLMITTVFIIQASNSLISSASGTTSGTTTSTTSGTTNTTTNSAGAAVGVSLPNGQGTNSIQSGQSYNYSDWIKNVYSFSMKAAIALCTLMVIYAGYKYLTSRGETGAINEAKDILFSTLMGAALLMLVVLVGHLAGISISIS